MSGTPKYWQFTPDQKAEIVLAGLRGDRAVRDVCREYEIAEALYGSVAFSVPGPASGAVGSWPPRWATPGRAPSTMDPAAFFLFAFGGVGGNDGSGGVALLDHETFDVIGPWELDRGDRYFGYDGWRHLDRDTVITSEWATPSMVENPRGR